MTLRLSTLRLRIDRNDLEGREARRTLECAADLLRRGKLVAFPTETVYGLGANALNAAAVSSIFVAKGRPFWDPVIVHVAGESGLEGLVENVPASARRLIGAFWPGPLTLLLPRSLAIEDVVTAGRSLVGMRMPADAVALALIRAAGVPVAAPSANTFGHTSPTTAAHVLDDLDGRIDAVVDAGPTVCGVESTVLDPNQTPMMIYRPGAVTREQLCASAGCAVEYYREAAGPATGSPEALPSPGVGLRHYAPRARLILIEARVEAGAGERWADALIAAVEDLAGPGVRTQYLGTQSGGIQRVGILSPGEFCEEIASRAPDAVVYRWGSWAEADSMARDLYAGLRSLDASGCDVILCPLPPELGVGVALGDRLRKASAR